MSDNNANQSRAPSSGSRWGPKVQPLSPDMQSYPPSGVTPMETERVHPESNTNAQLSSLWTAPTDDANNNSRKRPFPSPQTLSGTLGANTTVSNHSEGPAVPREQFLANFRLLEDVEWGLGRKEDGYDTDQTLAPRPKNKQTAEVCDCCDPSEGEKYTCRSDDCINFACREECNKNECVEHCGNQRITRRQFKKVEVFSAGPKGYGLRVLEDCVKGDIIQEYTGQAIQEKKLMKLFRQYQNERRLYIMALDDKVYLDARKAGGLARYINHSCNPNCKVEKWRVRGVYRAAVEALLPIKAGTELTFDYQWTRKAGRAPTKCHCGEANCRGTLEISKTVEEIQREQLISGKWVTPPKHKRPDERLVNSTIRIKQHSSGSGNSTPDTEGSDDIPVYFVGEVTEFNPKTNLHKILYQSLEERWQDLTSPEMEWMILDEEHSPTRNRAIARKADPPSTVDTATEKSSGSLLTAFSSAKPGMNQPTQYLFIQTPIKDALFQGGGLQERLERNHQVCIILSEHARPPMCNTNDPEEVAKFAALDQSLDGSVWKVTISGGDCVRANEIICKKVQYVQKRHQDEQNSTARPGSASTSLSIGNSDPSNLVDEIIFPRAIADHVKRLLPSMRERCRNISLQVMPSDSKAKKIARLVLEGTISTDLQNARIHVRNSILSICQELQPNDRLPMVSLPNGTDKIPRDFGILGGSLTKQEFEALVHNSSKDLSGSGPGPRSNASVDPARALIHSKRLSWAGIDLNKSPYFAIFESMYGPVWVQSEDDMGRISNHQLVGDARSTDTRKVYFGCDPGDLDYCWEMIRKRAEEAIRGVRFLHLGKDMVFWKYLVESNFLQYVERTTGSNVTFDTTTGNHIRIDGASSTASLQNLSVRLATMSSVERADLAEELVRLQIEVYRDQFTRNHSWIFGRDWAALNVACDEPVPDNLRQVAASFGKLDSRSAPHSCVEMAEIVAHLDLSGTVAAHAAIILYRFVSTVPETQIKARDAVLACVFIANKAQKAKKWRRLEAVLEAGYRTFYPGTQFDVEKEEVVKLEERVIDAEKEILETLQYDVFVRDMDTLEQVLSQKGNFVDGVLSFAFGGQLLGAGANLWLNHGIDYIFAASAAILKADLKSIVATLGLSPIKVSQTVKIIVENARYAKPSSDKVPSNPLLEGDRSRLDKYVARIDEICHELTSEEMKGRGLDSPSTSELHKRCADIAKANIRSYVIRGVPHHIISDHVLRQIDGIEAESGCSMFLSPSETVGDDDITIQGPWQAVAIADFLLRSGPELSDLPPAQDKGNEVSGSSQIQVKTSAGLIDAREICTSGGWSGTLFPLASKDHAEKQLGGKSCVAGKITMQALRHSGLRWWFRQAKGLSQTGSFTEMFCNRIGGGDTLQTLADMFSVEDESAFPVLSTFRSSNTDNGEKEDGPYCAVSLQRWPSERVSAKEEKRSRKSKRRQMSVGFSAGALQELQLLTVLHKLVPSPHGHPGFILPVGIAVPTDGPQQSDKNEKSPAPDGEDPMFSLFKTTQENELSATKEKKVKSSPHLVFQPCPFVLQRFLSRKKSDFDLLEAPVVLAAWFHDMVSALVHCHSNFVVLRALQPEHVIIDHSGVAKLSGLYRSSVIGPDERRHPPKIVKLAREMKKKEAGKKKEDEDDSFVTPFTPPEVLLGSPKHTKESDIWTLGCLLANILLSKAPFFGKDRQSLLMAMYKIVGVPSQSNFEDAARFPYYTKPPKKYRRDVEKAMDHMLKSEHSPKYGKAIKLIASMLHLDPSERCTAEEALNHDFLREHRINIEQKAYREEYVKEWMALKKKVVDSTRTSNEASSSQSEKRRALMLASATGAGTNDDGGDGLYDFEL